MASNNQITTALGILNLLCCCNVCVGSAFFPTNSAYGIFAAIAVPLELPHRNVFISYNFEANYNLPYTYNIPPIATGIEDEDIFSQPVAARQMSQSDDSCTNCTDAITKTITTNTPTTTMTSPVNATTNKNGKEESQRRRRRKV